MASLPFGFIVVLAAVVYSLLGVSLQLLVNVHSLILVVLGTLGILAVATPVVTLKDMLRSILKFRRPDLQQQLIDRALISLAKNREAKVENAHPLIAYAQELWMEGVDHDLFASMLAERAEEQRGTTEQVVIAARNLAKYPPALGMTGTVVGLISLFSGLTPDKRSTIAMSLALAMTATFYGLILANVFVMPFADRLYVMHVGESKIIDYVFRALVRIDRDEPQKISGRSTYVDAA